MNCEYTQEQKNQQEELIQKLLQSKEMVENKTMFYASYSLPSAQNPLVSFKKDLNTIYVNYTLEGKIGEEHVKFSETESRSEFLKEAFNKVKETYEQKTKINDLEDEVQDLKQEVKQERIPKYVFMGFNYVLAISFGLSFGTVLKHKQTPSLIPKLEDVNQNGLIDLVYETKKEKTIYLQTKEGEFVDYNTALRNLQSEVRTQQKQSWNEKYEPKRDSLKKVYKID